MTDINLDVQKINDKIDNLKETIYLLNEQCGALTIKNQMILSLFNSMRHDINHIYEGIELLFQRIEKIEEKICGEARQNASPSIN